jgi:hypothetical protein
MLCTCSGADDSSSMMVSGMSPPNEARWIANNSSV